MASCTYSFNVLTRENIDSFNAVMKVPAGIGAETGGHAGDTTPVARLLAGTCDTLFQYQGGTGFSIDYSSMIIDNSGLRFFGVLRTTIMSGMPVLSEAPGE